MRESQGEREKEGIERGGMRLLLLYEEVFENSLREDLLRKHHKFSTQLVTDYFVLNASANDYSFQFSSPPRIFHTL